MPGKIQSIPCVWYGKNLLANYIFRSQWLVEYLVGIPFSNKFILIFGGGCFNNSVSYGLLPISRINICDYIPVDKFSLWSFGHHQQIPLAYGWRHAAAL